MGNPPNHHPNVGRFEPGTQLTVVFRTKGTTIGNAQDPAGQVDPCWFMQPLCKRKVDLRIGASQKMAKNTLVKRSLAQSLQGAFAPCSLVSFPCWLVWGTFHQVPLLHSGTRTSLGSWGKMGCGFWLCPGKPNASCQRTLFQTENPALHTMATDALQSARIRCGPCKLLHREHLWQCSCKSWDQALNPLVVSPCSGHNIFCNGSSFPAYGTASGLSSRPWKSCTPTFSWPRWPMTQDRWFRVGFHPKQKLYEKGFFQGACSHLQSVFQTG